MQIDLRSAERSPARDAEVEDCPSDITTASKPAARKTTPKTRTGRSFHFLTVGTRRRETVEIGALRVGAGRVAADRPRRSVPALVAADQVFVEFERRQKNCQSCRA
jgi:hypothetical protein